MAESYTRVALIGEGPEKLIFDVSHSKNKNILCAAIREYERRIEQLQDRIRFCKDRLKKIEKKGCEVL